MAMQPVQNVCPPRLSNGEVSRRSAARPPTWACAGMRCGGQAAKGRALSAARAVRSADANCGSGTSHSIARTCARTSILAPTCAPIALCAGDAPLGLAMAPHHQTSTATACRASAIKPRCAATDQPCAIKQSSHAESTCAATERQGTPRRLERNARRAEQQLGLPSSSTPGGANQPPQNDAASPDPTRRIRAGARTGATDARYRTAPLPGTGVQGPALAA
jgi:hypothetical protein